MSNVAAIPSDPRFAHRHTKATMTLTGATGTPLAGRDVVEQTGHPH